MSAALRILDRIVLLSAYLGCAGIVALFANVMIDVGMRTFSKFPLSWPIPVSEYLLHFSVLMAAPYLVQTGGHITIESLLNALPRALEGFLRRLSYALCAVACCIIVYFSAHAGWYAYVNEITDVRSIVTPQVLYFAPMTFSFLMMAVLFLRLTLGAELSKPASPDMAGGSVV